MSELYAAQVRRLDEIYEKAYAVMVIDADLLAMRANADITEVAMRLRMCAWSQTPRASREHRIAQRLLLMAGDGIVDPAKLCLETLEGRRYQGAPQPLSHRLDELLL